MGAYRYDFDAEARGLVAPARPALSARAAKAVEVLKAGGEFRYGLERQWGGGEKFVPRLKVGGKVVKGYGPKVYYELLDAGLLEPAGKGSSVASYYRLKGGV